MKNWLWLFLFLLLFEKQCFGYELILPKNKKAEVSSNYIFFVGKATNSESIYINNQKIYTAPNGAFAHSVRLRDGENRILVRSNYKTQIYNFHKKKLIPKQKEQIKEFSPVTAIVQKDRIPLRSTPEEQGSNIISGLYKDTNLLINGSQENFYRVLLSQDKEAWIAKDDVVINCNENSVPANFINTDNQRFKNATIQTISFSKNLPYTVEERNDEIIFKVYNPELSYDSVYTLNIPAPAKYTYSVSLKDGTYTFKVSELPKTLQECIIVIDAGHGGTEKGAVGCLGDNEKDINLKIALELQEQLKQMGATVIMTRECDGYVNLKNRINIGKNNNADIFISIHLNSIGDSPINLRKNRGTSIYYYNLAAKTLAESLEHSITQKAGTTKNGIHQKGFAVIRPTEYIGILVEAAYMTNPLDSTLYQTKDFAHNVAQGIADGIVEFINK